MMSSAVDAFPVPKSLKWTQPRCAASPVCGACWARPRTTAVASTATRMLSSNATRAAALPRMCFTWQTGRPQLSTRLVRAYCAGIEASVTHVRDPLALDMIAAGTTSAAAARRLSVACACVSLCLCRAEWRWRVNRTPHASTPACSICLSSGVRLCKTKNFRVQGMVCVLWECPILPILRQTLQNRATARSSCPLSSAAWHASDIWKFNNPADRPQRR